MCVCVCARSVYVHVYARCMFICVHGVCLCAWCVCVQWVYVCVWCGYERCVCVCTGCLCVHSVFVCLLGVYV